MIYFTKHQRGPALPGNASKTRTFRSYVDAATWAEENLAPGLYWVRNSNGVNLWSGMRECRVKQSQRKCEWVDARSGCWIEGRGNV